MTCTSSQEVPSFRFVRPTRYSGNRERKRESRKRRSGRSGVRRQRLCDAAADAHDRCYCWGRGKKTPTTATPSPPWGLSQLPALFTAAKKKEKAIAGRTTAHNIHVYGHARSGSANCPATFVMIPQMWFCQAHYGCVVERGPGDPLATPSPLTISSSLTAPVWCLPRKD